MIYYEVNLASCDGKQSRKHVYATYGEAQTGVDVEASRRGLRAGFRCPVAGYLLDQSGNATWSFTIRKHELAEYLLLASDSGETLHRFGSLERFAADRSMWVDGTAVRDILTGAVMYSTVKAP